MRSYNIEITGSLSIDAFVVNTGIQVSGSLHSSTGAELDFSLLNNGNGINFNLKLPQKKQEIFSIDHKIVFITQERGQETVTNNLKFSSKKKEFSGCFDQLYKYIGATFCTDVSLTVPTTQSIVGVSGYNGGTAFFPLNGGNKISVWLEVENSYNFHVAYDNNKENSHQTLELSFDTPDSDIKRLTIVKFDVATKPLPSIKIILDSTYRQASIDCGLINDKNEIGLFVNAVNGPDQYHGKFGLKKLGQEPRLEYHPVILFQTPNQGDDNIMGFKVNGKIIVDSSAQPTRYQFNNIEIIGVQPATINVNGWFDIDGTKFRSDMNINQGDKKFSLIGDIELISKHFKMDMGVLCNANQYANGKITIDASYGDNYVSVIIILLFL